MCFKLASNQIIRKKFFRGMSINDHIGRRENVMHAINKDIYKTAKDNLYEFSLQHTIL